MLIKMYYFFIIFSIFCIIFAYNTLISMFFFFFIISLIATLLFFLQIEFLGYIILLIYLGGILVFFLFTLLLLNPTYRYIPQSIFSNLSYATFFCGFFYSFKI